MKKESLVPLVLRSVSLAMGVAVVVLSVLKQTDPNAAVSMLGIGLACLALSTFAK